MSETISATTLKGVTTKMMQQTPGRWFDHILVEQEPLAMVRNGRVIGVLVNRKEYERLTGAPVSAVLHDEAAEPHEQIVMAETGGVQ